MEPALQSLCICYRLALHTRSYVQVGGYSAKLPSFWWTERDPTHYGTYLLRRACPFVTNVQPSLTVRPALPGVVRDTNEEELKAVQALISLKDSNSTPGTSSSLVILRSKQFILYCEKLTFAPLGTPINTALYCTAAKVSYDWSYFGPPSYENEAELFLSTLE